MRDLKLRSLSAVTVLLLSTLLMQDYVHGQEEGPYMDPCRSSAFFGDVALSDDERDRFLDEEKPLSYYPTQKWPTWVIGKDFAEVKQHQQQQKQHSTDQAINKNNSLLYDQEQQTMLERLLPPTGVILTEKMVKSFRGLGRQFVRNRWRDYFSRLGLNSTRVEILAMQRMQEFVQARKLWFGANNSTTTTGRPVIYHLDTQQKAGFSHREDDDAPGTDEAVKRRSKRAATAYKSRTWPDGVIPYVIQNNFSSETKAIIIKAMRHWEVRTCLSFVEREPHHLAHIVFTEKGCGCCSFVGRRSEKDGQAISIGKNCDKLGIVIHELGHVIGFWHEHTRPDRDDHVEILTENVVVGQDFNFKKMDPGEVNSLGEPYDYSSIMHYAETTFSRTNKEKTLKPRVWGQGIGQRIRLSNGDVRQTLKLYSCPMCGRSLFGSNGTVSSPQLSDKAPFEMNAHMDWMQTSPLKNNPHNGEESMVDDEQDHKPKRRTRRDVSFDENDTLGFGMGWDDMSVFDHFNFDRDYDCQWRIIGSNGEHIELDLTKMDIPISGTGESSCNDHYLEVHDGYTFNKRIGRYCGKMPIDKIISTGTRLGLKYHKAKTARGRGFAASYKTVCGGQLKMEKGSIYSPAYPEDYPVNQNCVWVITVSEGFSVALTFTTFDLEKGSNCTYDHVEVRDGPDENSRLLAKMCSQMIHPPIKSTNNQMYVKFYSDASVVRSGFTATFEQEFDECKTATHGCMHTCVNTLGSYVCTCYEGYELSSDGKSCEDTCGMVFTNSSGLFSSPNYPNVYPNKKGCHWRIHAPMDKVIFLKFTHFDLEGQMNESCTYDRLAITSGPPQNQHRIGNYCGQTNPGVISTHSHMVSVEFQSDDSVQRTGFQVQYIVDENECLNADKNRCSHSCTNTIGGFNCSCPENYLLRDDNFTCEYRDQQNDNGRCVNQTLTNVTGELTSPNFDHKKYPPQMDCQWEIRTVPGHRIELTFQHFNLEGVSPNCQYDYVLLFVAKPPEAKAHARLCGERLLVHTQKYTSLGPSMLVQFRSDTEGELEGFKANYSTVCGGNLNADETTHNIYSHPLFGESDYPINQYCEWHIVGNNTSQFVRLRFLYFELEESTHCSYDFLKVENSTSKLTTLCGSNLPQQFVSDSNRLKLVFKTDDNQQRKGFHVQYEMISTEERDQILLTQTGDTRVADSYHFNMRPVGDSAFSYIQSNSLFRRGLAATSIRVSSPGVRSPHDTWKQKPRSSLVVAPATFTRPQAPPLRRAPMVTSRYIPRRNSPRQPPRPLLRRPSPPQVLPQSEQPTGQLRRESNRGASPRAFQAGTHTYLARAPQPPRHNRR